MNGIIKNAKGLLSSKSYSVAVSRTKYPFSEVLNVIYDCCNNEDFSKASIKAKIAKKFKKVTDAQMDDALSVCKKNYPYIKWTK